MKRAFLIASIIICTLTSCTTSSIINGDGENRAVNEDQGVLPGRYSVGEDRTVSFSQGNLQYNPSGNKWRLAKYQYETIGATNSRIQQNYPGWIDLFGWGTSGKENDGEGCMPYMTSTYDDDYIQPDTAEVEEWGLNEIGNGALVDRRWRTLTANEWEYLLRDRPRAAELQVKATVCEVHGLLLLPDDWIDIENVIIQPCTDCWTTNHITPTQWEDLEKHGAVFLPATGTRENHAVNKPNTTGMYWSMTRVNDGAYALRFDQSRLIEKTLTKLHYGMAVRLVTDNYNSK